MAQEGFMRIDRKCLLVGAVFVVGAFVWASQAFPQTLRPTLSLVRIPYTVDSVFVRYADDGSPTVDMYCTLYSHNGSEILLSSFVPGHPFATAVRRALAATGLVLFHLTTLFHPDTEQAERAAVRISKGCVDHGQVVGRETILGYPTVAIQSSGREERTTMWQSPDLGCFPLRLTNEQQRPDGTFRLLMERRALKVTSNL
jgi:hypothetical protein